MNEANDATLNRDHGDPGSAAHRLTLRRARDDNQYYAAARFLPGAKRP